MKRLLFIFLPACFIVAFSVRKSPAPLLIQSPPKAEEIKMIDSIVGDFNGDNQPEYAWVQKTGNEKSGELVIQNVCTIRFSDERIPPLNTNLYCIFGNLWNEGDLDEDGADDLALVLYNQREWSLCYIFSLKKRIWYQRNDPFMVWGGLDPEDIQKLPGQKGKLQIKHLVPHNDTLLVETHTISIY
jgi:hypothetical protein